MKKCLLCYQFLADPEQEVHPSCAKKLFGLPKPPAFPYAEEDLKHLAYELITAQTSITGVQPKLTLHLTGKAASKTPARWTLVGLWGGYILKPPSNLYPQLPEVEDVTMHLAAIAKIKTAPHGLIRLHSGNLAYITRRVDRTQQGKLAMEDMCQLTERLTEDKYHGSYEQIGKTIQKYSANPGLDLVNFFELVLFSFLTGNADMHLKNFSLLEKPGLGMTLAPAYDLVNTALVNPTDTEDLALTLNGKKKKIMRQDFEAAMRTLNLEEKQQQNIFHKMVKALPAWLLMLDQSFLEETHKEQYKSLILERMQRMGLLFSDPQAS
jgi:serine/threonine-protein kinase HipA